MSPQKQNIHTRYTNSFTIFAIWILVLVFVIRFGILIQRSQSDLLSIANQIQYKNNQYISESKVKVIGSKKNKKQASTNTWLIINTWAFSTWN